MLQTFGVFRDLFLFTWHRALKIAAQATIQKLFYLRFFDISFAVLLKLQISCPQTKECKQMAFKDASICQSFIWQLLTYTPLRSKFFFIGEAQAFDKPTPPHPWERQQCPPVPFHINTRLFCCAVGGQLKSIGLPKGRISHLLKVQPFFFIYSFPLMPIGLRNIYAVICLQT